MRGFLKRCDIEEDPRWPEGLRVLILVGDLCKIHK